MNTPDIERRALALYERLSERPRTPRYRERLLARESQTVLDRVAALERGGARGPAAMPTELVADDVFALGLVLRGLLAGGGADADLTAVAN